MLDVMVIGHGYAGRRFVRALGYLKAQQPDRLRMVGLVDRDPEKLAGRLEAPKFRDCATALRETDPDAVVLTVNEFSHYEVLHQLSEQNCAILCEKPLTATYEEAQRLRLPLARHLLTLNMVERFSPTLDTFFEWRRSQPGLKALRVEFFWGKNRVRDPRPTMGVLSEVTHPLDLIDYVFPFSRWRVREVNGVISDFARRGDRALDSMQLLVETEEYSIIGHTSFVWPRRQRSVTAFLRNAKGELFRLFLDFDQPRWDCDLLEIRRIDETTGTLESVLDKQVGNSDFPSELDGIHKVSRFVDHSLDAVATGRRDRRLVDLEQALKIQNLLRDLEKAAEERRSVHTLPIDGAGAHVPRRAGGTGQ